LRQVGLTPARLNLLMVLFLCGDRALTVSELGELLVVSPGNITGLVDGLVKDRLVRRVAYPGDRRAVAFELTTRGCRLVRWLAPLHPRLIRSLMSGLSRAQARSLARLLDEMRKRVRRAPAPTISRRPFEGPARLGAVSFDNSHNAQGARGDAIYRYLDMLTSIGYAAGDVTKDLSQADGGGRCRRGRPIVEPGSWSYRNGCQA